MQQICSAEEKEKFDNGIQHGLTINYYEFEVWDFKWQTNWLRFETSFKKNMYFF